MKLKKKLEIGAKDKKGGWKVAAVVAVVVDDVAMELELQLQYNCI